MINNSQNTNFVLPIIGQEANVEQMQQTEGGGLVVGIAAGVVAFGAVTAFLLVRESRNGNGNGNRNNGNGNGYYYQGGGNGNGGYNYENGNYGSGNYGGGNDYVQGGNTRPDPNDPNATRPTLPGTVITPPDCPYF